MFEVFPLILKEMPNFLCHVIIMVMSFWICSIQSSRLWFHFLLAYKDVTFVLLQFCVDGLYTLTMLLSYIFVNNDNFCLKERRDFCLKSILYRPFANGCDLHHYDKILHLKSRIDIYNNFLLRYLSYRHMSLLLPYYVKHGNENIAIEHFTSNCGCCIIINNNIHFVSFVIRCN